MRLLEIGAAVLLGAFAWMHVLCCLGNPAPSSSLEEPAAARTRPYAPKDPDPANVDGEHAAHDKKPVVAPIH